MELEKEQKLKKPTNIIIFIDSISYGETSLFIKNLQNTGGAIIAGYLGNQKNREIFDSSQGPSGNLDFSWTNYYKNLEKNGFRINSITVEESFEKNYKKDNMIPREYKENRVDERVSIYSYFDDSSYEEFKTETKNIFEKYNVIRDVMQII